MPDAENDILSFKNYQFQLKAPFRIYADFKCFLPKIEGCSPDPNTSSSTATHKHVPSGFCHLVVSDVEKYCKPPVVYRGPDVMKHFIECVLKENEEIQKILSTPANMIYTQQDKQDFINATQCDLCEKPLGADRVRDHCHLTRKFRSALHNSCNLLYKLSKKVPVLFHNGKKYYSHLILQELRQFGEKKQHIMHTQ